MFCEAQCLGFVRWTFTKWGGPSPFLQPVWRSVAPLNRVVSRLFCNALHGLSSHGENRVWVINCLKSILHISTVRRCKTFKMFTALLNMITLQWGLTFAFKWEMHVNHWKAVDMVASGGDKAFIKHNLSRLQSIQSNLGQKSSILQGMIETFFFV